MAFEQMQREVEKLDEPGKKGEKEVKDAEEAIDDEAKSNDAEAKPEAKPNDAEAKPEAKPNDAEEKPEEKPEAKPNDDENEAKPEANGNEEADVEADDEADDLNRHVMMVLVGNAVVTTLFDAAFDFGFVGDIVSNVVLLSFSFVALMKVARRNILSLIMLWTAVNGIWMNVVAYMRFNQVRKSMTTTLTLAVLSMPFLAFVYLNHHDVQEWMHLPLIIMFVISSILQGAWIGMGTCAVETPGNANLQGNVKTTASSITFALAALVVGVLVYRVRSIHLKGSQASRPEMLA